VTTTSYSIEPARITEQLNPPRRSLIVTDAATSFAVGPWQLEDLIDIFTWGDLACWDLTGDWDRLLLVSLDLTVSQIVGIDFRLTLAAFANRNRLCVNIIFMGSDHKSLLIGEQHYPTITVRVYGKEFAQSCLPEIDPWQAIITHAIGGVVDVQVWSEELGRDYLTRLDSGDSCVIVTPANDGSQAARELYLYLPTGRVQAYLVPRIESSQVINHRPGVPVYHSRP
jgi:hypothetical protein